MSDKGYNSMSREELKSLSHPVSNGETAETEQDKARKDKTSLRFTLPTPHKVKDKKETNGQCSVQSVSKHGGMLQKLSLVNCHKNINSCLYSVIRFELLPFLEIEEKLKFNRDLPSCVLVFGCLSVFTEKK